MKNTINAVKSVDELKLDELILSPSTRRYIERKQLSREEVLYLGRGYSIDLKYNPKVAKKMFQWQKDLAQGLEDAGFAYSNPKLVYDIQNLYKKLTYGMAISNEVYEKIADIADQIATIIDELSDREVKVFHLLYGIDDGIGPISHADVAKELNTYIGRIRQIEAKILAKRGGVIKNIIGQG